MMKKNMSKTVTNMMVAGAALLMALPVATVQASANSDSDKTINWTVPSDLKTLDPGNVPDVPSEDAVLNSGEGLYRIGSNGEPKLAAAESASVSQDGLTWTFKLRPNLKWSDGSQVTANDFVYAWQRANDPKNAMAGSIFFSGLKNAQEIQAGKMSADQLGVKATDDSTLQVQLAAPLPQFKQELAMMYFMPVKQSFAEAQGKKFGTTSSTSLSSGPYVVKGWNGSSSSYKLVKNPYYWDAKNVKTDEVKVTSTASAQTSYNMYKAGSTDWAVLNATQARNSKSNKGYKVVNTAATTYLEINPTKKNLNNLKLRQAMQYAVNRDGLAKDVLYGAATPAKTFVAANTAKDADTGKDFADSAATGAVSYQPAKAKKLWNEGLKEVGKKSLTLTLESNDTDAAKQTAEYVQQQYEKNLPNLKVNVKTIPAKQYNQFLSDGKFEVGVTTWNVDYHDPVDMLQTLVKGASWNYTQWSDPAYDALYTKATNQDANNPKQRATDLVQLEQMAEKKVAVSPLTYSKLTALQNPKVKGVVINTTGGTFDFKTATKH